MQSLLTKMNYIPLVNNRNKYIQQAGIIAGLFCFVLLQSCSSNNKVIASVNDSELTENDAFLIMSHLGLDPDDSITTSAFIAEWIDQEIFKAEIKTEFPETWQLISLRSNAFSGDLAKYYLEEIELKKSLDQV